MAILTLLSISMVTLLLRTNAFYLNIGDQSARIVGGNETTIENAKFVVNIRIGSIFICGGSLVAPKVVITSAYCVHAIEASDVSVIGGATYILEEGIKRSVSSIHIPKEYNYFTMDMDIAILILSEPMEGDNIATIELCETEWNTGDEMTVYGWGQIALCDEEITNQLRSVNVPVVEQAKCEDIYKEFVEITNSMFCAGDLKGEGACWGDSGGPAVFENKLCGIVSWGMMGCANSDYPVVHTNIQFVRDFIDETMNMY